MSNRIIIFVNEGKDPAHFVSPIIGAEIKKNIDKGYVEFVLTKDFIFGNHTLLYEHEPEGIPEGAKKIYGPKWTWWWGD